jgi:hypothetical protein
MKPTPPDANSVAPSAEDGVRPNRKKIDLRRFQDTTISTEVQVQLSTLQRPLLDESELVPPPPIVKTDASFPPVLPVSVAAGNHSDRIDQRVWWLAGACVVMALTVVVLLVSKFLSPPTQNAQPNASSTQTQAAPVVSTVKVAVPSSAPPITSNPAVVTTAPTAKVIAIKPPQGTQSKKRLLDNKPVYLPE